LREEVGVEEGRSRWIAGKGINVAVAVSVIVWVMLEVGEGVSVPVACWKGISSAWKSPPLPDIALMNKGESPILAHFMHTIDKNIPKKRIGFVLFHEER